VEKKFETLKVQKIQNSNILQLVKYLNLV